MGCGDQHSFHSNMYFTHGLYATHVFQSCHVPIIFERSNSPDSGLVQISLFYIIHRCQIGLCDATFVLISPGFEI